MCSINIVNPWFSYFVASGSSGGSLINNIQLLNKYDIAVTWVLSSGIAGIGRNGGVEFEKERNQDGHYIVHCSTYYSSPIAAKYLNDS